MLGDTIVAQASAPGASARAVLRLSGPAALAAAELVFAPPLARVRAQVDGALRLGDGVLPALALVMVGPASFTGEDTVELHVPGSPMLVRSLLDTLLAEGRTLGVREALPGEFTARACQNGRLTLAQAEGVLLLLHAADTAAAAAAAQWLRGGYVEAATELRARLQDALALLEVGLDFGDGEAGAVPTADWLSPLAAVAAAAPGGEVLLLGRANAGKSSLVNALLGRDAALVDGAPGTTRDLLRAEVLPGVALWDAPGDLDEPTAADAAALALRERLAGRAASLLCVLDATAPAAPPSVLASPLPWLAIVWTKCDLVAQPPPLPPALAARAGDVVPVVATSAARGAGLEPLRELLRRSATAGVVDAGGPLRSALSAAALAVERARGAAGLGAELAAVELQAALAALDGIGGSHSPEHLLDRIYGRFCLGK
jgi:tRNA modification GTPase